MTLNVLSSELTYLLPLSLFSLEMLGDDQIEQLMKDTTIQNAAENLLETGTETQAEKSSGN